jgi:hypothetical protein
LALSFQREDRKKRMRERMIAFGPVAEAAKGGQSSPTFDLCVGFAVLIATWVSYGKQRLNSKVSIWIAIGVSAICAVFIYSGLHTLLR